MERITKSDVGRAFQRWLDLIGGREAKAYNDVGGYMLDNNGTYGGVRIVQVTTPGGGEHNVTARRYKFREFVDMVQFASDTLYEIEFTRVDTKGR